MRSPSAWHRSTYRATFNWGPTSRIPTPDAPSAWWRSTTSSTTCSSPAATCFTGTRQPGRSGRAVSRAKEVRMAEQKFPVMYHSRLWRFAPKILYNQSDLDNFLAVVTLDDWVKSPDPPIDPAE